MRGKRLIGSFSVPAIGRTRRGGIVFDAARALAPVCRSGGFSHAEWAALHRRARPLMATLRRTRAEGKFPFAELPYDLPALKNTLKEARLRREAAAVLVLGMGGSSLGLRAILGALGEGKIPVRVLDNVDPETARAALQVLPWNRTLVNVVTKSGTTAETIALYLRVLAEAHGHPLTQNVVITTDSGKDSDLARAAAKEGFARLAIPPAVGGRFSVLTSAALFPAAVAGLPVKEILEGARLAADSFWHGKSQNDPTLLAALLLHAFAEKKRRKTFVLMPYADRMLPLSHWAAQLWAESLGKKKSRRGRVIHAGSTPVVARGASDQHSQLQLYAEGPRDKVLFFLRVGRFLEEGALASAHRELPAFSYLAGRSLAELFAAEAEATADSLAAQGCPSISLGVPALDARTLGALFYFFEMATVAAAELWDVNAFDQPGVEVGKHAARALMEETSSL